MIFDRNGKISILRVALLALGIGIVLIVGAIISFYADRAARQRPLDVALFPGAAVSVSNQLSPTDLETVYTADSVLPEDVLTHYQTRMNEFYGMGTEPELRNWGPNRNCGIANVFHRSGTMKRMMRATAASSRLNTFAYLKHPASIAVSTHG